MNSLETTALGFFNPGFALIAAGLLCALSPWVSVRRCMLIVGPIVALGLILNAPFGEYGATDALRFNLVLFRLDELSSLIGLAFGLSALIAGIYAFHHADRLESAAALAHVGGAVTAVFAGDLVTFFLGVEVMALWGVGIVLAPRTAAAATAAGRYLIVQLLAGGLLAAGVALTAGAERSLSFNSLRPETWGGGLILAALGVKTAFPGVHFWLKDAYPNASPTGAVFLAPVTTILGIYGLARAFEGVDILIAIGAVMVVFPIFFAVAENDLRRVLSYALISQLGFMVMGIGLGGAIAVGGALTLAFSHVFCNMLLFMGLGTVLHRTGTAKATELGGLWRTMPLTAIFTVIGAASVAAIPLFAGFAGKSLLLAGAAADPKNWWVALVCLIGMAGALGHAGLRVPMTAFFGGDSGQRPKEAPLNMLVAMSFAAGVCVFLGINPWWLQDLLPVPAEHNPLTLEAILPQLQLLSFAGLAFAALRRTGLAPADRDRILLDIDWLFRRPGRALTTWSVKALLDGEHALGRVGRALASFFGSSGPIADKPVWRVTTGSSAPWIAGVLAAAFAAAFFRLH